MYGIRGYVVSEKSRLDPLWICRNCRKKCRKESLTRSESGSNFRAMDRSRCFQRRQKFLKMFRTLHSLTSGRHSSIRETAAEGDADAAICT